MAISVNWTSEQERNNTEWVDFMICLRGVGGIFCCFKGFVVSGSRTRGCYIIQGCLVQVIWRIIGCLEGRICELTRKITGSF